MYVHLLYMVYKALHIHLFQNKIGINGPDLRSHRNKDQKCEKSFENSTYIGKFYTSVTYLQQ
jgi:hypothetical protein